MAQGDTDGIDANGDIIINGGTVRVTAQFPFDYDGKAELNGGDVYVNGAKVTQLINQFGGSPGEPPKRPDGSFPQDREPPEGFEPPQNGEPLQGGEPPQGFAPPQGGGFPKGMPPQEDPFPFGGKDGADRKGAETAPAVPGTET